MFDLCDYLPESKESQGGPFHKKLLLLGVRQVCRIFLSRDIVLLFRWNILLNLRYTICNINLKPSILMKSEPNHPRTMAELVMKLDTEDVGEICH